METVTHAHENVYEPITLEEEVQTHKEENIEECIEQDNRKYAKYSKNDTITTLVHKDANMTNREYKEKKQSTYIEIQMEVDRLAITVSTGSIDEEDADALLAATHILRKLFKDKQKGKRPEHKDRETRKRIAMDTQNLREIFQKETPIDNPTAKRCRTTTTIQESHIDTDTTMTTIEYNIRAHPHRMYTETLGISREYVSEVNNITCKTMEDTDTQEENEDFPIPDDDKTLLENLTFKYKQKIGVTKILREQTRDIQQPIVIYDASRNIQSTQEMKDTKAITDIPTLQRISTSPHTQWTLGSTSRIEMEELIKNSHDKIMFIEIIDSKERREIRRANTLFKNRTGQITTSIATMKSFGT